jgi:hypothetical protein
MPPGDPTGNPQRPAAPPQPQPPQPQPQRPAAPPINVPPMEMVRISNFIARAAHHPELRAQVADLFMKGDPNGLGKAFQDVALDRRFQALERKMADKELQGQINEARAGQTKDKKTLVDSGRYSEEQIGDIEKLMTARGYHSYKDAAILYDADHPPEPKGHEYPTSNWEFPTVQGKDGKMIPFDQFKKDPIAESRNAAYRVIDTFKRGALPPQFAA